MKNIINKVKKAIAEQHLLEKHEAILIACSGGSDSVALFFLLQEVSSDYNSTLSLAHLNHGIRKEADEDEAFVYRLGNAQGVKVVSKKIDCIAMSKEWRLSLEGAARRARYEFFKEQAKLLGISKVALAHTENDQAETILMRLIRGSGMKGLSGIPPMRHTEDVSFIRPLLKCTKEEIMAYLSYKNIPYRIDHTNLERCCTRNKIRLDLIPYIQKELNPSIVSTLSRTAALIRKENRSIEWYLSQIEKRSDQGDKVTRKENEEGGYSTGWKEFLLFKTEGSTSLHSLDLENLKNLPSEIQQDILLQFLKRWHKGKIARSIHYAHIQAIIELLEREEGGGELDLPEGVKIYRQGRRLFLTLKDSDNKDISVDATRAGKRKDTKTQIDRCKGREGHIIAIPGSASFPALGLTLFTRIYPRNEIDKIPNDPMTAYLDYEKIQEPLRIRTRIPGDRFHPLGMPCEKKLKEFFIDAKIIKGVRDTWPLLTFGSNICWVVGLRIGDPFRITEKTSKVLMVIFNNQVGSQVGSGLEL